MTLDVHSAADQEDSLENVLLAYLKATEAGQAPDREEWLARYPHVAGELAEYFAANDRLDPAFAPLRGQRGAGAETGPYHARGAVEAEEPAASQDAPTGPHYWSGAKVPGAAACEPPFLPTIPGYEILKELGHGGMGVVYQARHIALKRLVALKMIKGGAADENQRARFRAEAEAVARLGHPNIVQIYEVGEHETQPFFSLEFVAGGSLHDQLAGTPLPAEQAAPFVEILARAMHAAHQRGIVHRDLKPANILLGLSREPPASAVAALAGGSRLNDCVPKITDFGLAKQLDKEQGHTQSGAIVGTVSYMAPEQAQPSHGAVGPPADVYALGAILYEMLTGRPPFKAANPLDTLFMVIGEEPVPPSRLQPKVPRDLETICLKCLHKEPAKRYASAETLAEDLHRFRAGEPILARPAGVWARTAKWVRRKPVAAALAGVSVLAACVCVALIGLYAIYATQELKRRQDQDDVRERSSQTLLRAQQHEAAGRWQAAYTELAKAQEALDAQPDLRADELRAEVQRRLAVVRAGLREQEQRQQARLRVQDFQGPYDDALSYYTEFTGLDREAARARTRRAARTALAVYGLDNAPSLLERDRPFHNAAEHARLAGACYELLLIWAVSEGDAPAGSTETEGRERARKALTLLARAARLGEAYGLETRAYHVRKARYTARSQGAPFDPATLDGMVHATPSGVLDWFLEALDRYQVGQYEPARQACREVLRQQKDHYWARYVEALCGLRLRHWGSARDDLTMCISRRPGFVWPRVQRGFATSELGFVAKTKDPLLAEEEFRKAEEDFASALGQSRDPLLHYAALVNRGVLNIRQQQWTQAAADLRQALPLQPQRYEGYVNLAQALKGAGRLEEAVTALDRAIERAPHLALLYQSRARLQLLRKHRAAARADFEQAIAHEPKDSKSDRLVNNLVELGKLLHRAGDEPAALACYDRALRLQPAFVLAQRFRAETLLALERPAEAGKALDQYLAASRDAPADVYLARGLIHAATQQLPAAIEMYTLALRLTPEDTATRCHRGWTYLSTDAVRLALDDFEACLRQDAANADALAGRGNARIRLRQRDEALEDAEMAQKHGPLTDRLWYQLTRLYAQAAGQLEMEARSGRTAQAALAAQRVAVCQEKALACLRRTLDLIPAAQRADFWRRRVEPDTALTSIRRTKVYAELAADYAATGP